jgi:PKD repeat protein
MPKQMFRRVRDRERSLGQSFVEFALLFPVLLLIVMVGIDFGRVYLGWVNTQNMARIAANYAANNADAWAVPGDPTRQARYLELIANDARAINCELPDPIPGPVFPTGLDLGDPVTVHIDCNFAIITPIINSVLGSNVLVSAETTFPVKAGIVGSVPGGAPPVPAPTAAFVVSPTSTMEDQPVDVTDTSTNNPTSWTWTFGDGSPASFIRNPPPHVYDNPGTYTISLVVSNSGGTSSPAQATVEVLAAPTTGPIPNFSGTPRSGLNPPGIDVAFTDLSTGAPTTWLWDFGDGATSSLPNPSHLYNTVGTFDVTLTVSDGTTTNAQTKTGYIIVAARPCIVPNLVGIRKNSAQGIWTAAGFTTTITFAPGQGNYKIGVQSPQGGLTNPQGGCNSPMSVGP